MKFDFKIKMKVGENLIELNATELNTEAEFKAAKKSMLFMTSTLAQDLTKITDSMKISSEIQKPLESPIMSSEMPSEEKLPEYVPEMIQEQPSESVIEPVNMITLKQWQYLCRLGYTGVDMNTTTAEEASALIKQARAEKGLK